MAWSTVHNLLPAVEAPDGVLGAWLFAAPLEVFGIEQFRTGLAVGVAALVLGIALGVVARLSPLRRPPPLAGLLLAGAGLVALERTGTVLTELVLALGTLGAIGFVGDLLPRRWWVLVVPPAAWAAWWLSQETFGPRTARDDGCGCLLLLDRAWVDQAVFATVIVGGTLAAAFHRHWRTAGISTPLMPISLLGVYFTVPDTEQAAAVLGATALLVLLGWPVALLSLGIGGAFASVGLLAWVSVVGGVGRPGSIVGALGCVGLLAVEPVGRLLAGGRSPLELIPARQRTPVSAVLHLVLVFIASRIAGLQEAASDAARIVAVTGVVAVLAATAGGWSVRLRDRRSRAASDVDVPTPHEAS